MTVITTRELKQNPAAAIRQVLASGRPVSITAHGSPTGAVIAPEASSKRPWVSGRALRQALEPMTEEASQAWQADLQASRGDFGRDLWGDQG